MTNSWYFAIGVLVFIVGLAISIGLHELGHLIPAKIFKVPVSKYFIGFGPTLFSRKRGETEYGVKAIPLGGYISIGGMYPPKPEAVQANEASAKRSRMPAFLRKIVDDAQDSNAESMKGFDESRAFYHLPIWKRIIVMFGGPFMNLLLAFVLFTILLTGIGKPGTTTTVASVNPCVISLSATSNECAPDAPVSPAAAAGFLAGDDLVSVAGTPVTSWSTGTALIQQSAGKPIQIGVLRDGKPVILTVTPALSERYVVDAAGQPVKNPDGTYTTQQVGVIGITPVTGLVPQPITTVFPTMWETVAGTTQMIANLPSKMVDVSSAAFGTADRSIDSPISVVGVGRVAGEIAGTDVITTQSKVATLIGIMASLNVALFVFNLIPLLPLDGGHIAGALFEGARRQIAKLRRKKDPGPFDASVLMPLTFVVMAVLMAMSALLIYADIVKPVNLLG